MGVFNSTGMIMEDKRMLELAAKAAGLEVEDYIEGFGIAYFNGNTGGNRFNPLTDDSDALRLAVKLNIRVEPNVIDCDGETTNRTFVDFVGGEFTTPHNDDPYAATRRAIVRAAAEIGKAMQ